MKEENSDGNNESISNDKMSNIKEGLYVFYHATMAMSLNEMFPQCKQFADLFFTTSVMDIGTYPHYVKLGFSIMCEMEKGKVKDWKKVKRSIRECAKMEGVTTKSNKPMLLKFIRIEFDKKYKKVVNADVVELGKKPIAIVEHCTQDVAIDAFIKQLGRMQGGGVRDDLI
eukprot:9371311-Ditylum_brightwellii.AAC.1